MIGLIFGETEFPKYILKKIKRKSKYLIIDLTKKKIFKKGSGLLVRFETEKNKNWCGSRTWWNNKKGEKNKIF